MDELIPGIILTVVAMAPGILALILGRKKEVAEINRAEADASDRITQAAITLVEPLKKRIEEMGKEIEILGENIRLLEEEQQELICGIDKLIFQIKALGHEPIWKPKRRAKKE